MFLLGLCGRSSRGSNNNLTATTSDEVLAQANAQTQSVVRQNQSTDATDTVVEEVGANSGKEAEEAAQGEGASESRKSPFIRYQGPEITHPVCGVSIPPADPRATDPEADDASDSGTGVNRFVGVSGPQEQQGETPMAASPQLRRKPKQHTPRAARSLPGLESEKETEHKGAARIVRRLFRSRNGRQNTDGWQVSQFDNQTSPAVRGGREEASSFYTPPEDCGPQGYTATPDSSTPKRKSNILPVEASLEAVQVALYQVCDTMKGSVQRGKKVVRSSIRLGVSAVIADVDTLYGEQTMLLFPDKNRKKRHMKLHEQPHMCECMPMIISHNDIFSHEEEHRTVTLPCSIFVNKVTMLGEHLNTSTVKTMDGMFDIWLQLAKVVREFHARGWYLHELITYTNVVQVPLGCRGNPLGWTLLELGNTSRARARERADATKFVLKARHAPPELAQALKDEPEQKAALNPVTDMWMFGMLVYQVMTGEPFWPKAVKDKEVLDIISDPSKKLPHEERPVLPLVQEILSILLHRDPTERISSSALVARLEHDMPTAVDTVNPGPVVTEEAIVLQALEPTNDDYDGRARPIARAEPENPLESAAHPTEHGPIVSSAGEHDEAAPVPSPAQPEEQAQVASPAEREEYAPASLPKQHAEHAALASPPDPEEPVLAPSPELPDQPTLVASPPPEESVPNNIDEDTAEARAPNTIAVSSHEYY